MLQGYPISSSIWSRCCNRGNDSQQSSLNTCYYNHNASGNDAINPRSVTFKFWGQNWHASCSWDTHRCKVSTNRRKARHFSPALWGCFSQVGLNSLVCFWTHYITTAVCICLRRIPCILVTGCGYPDIATRSMVRSISERHPVRFFWFSPKNCWTCSCCLYFVVRKS